jgi:hypothetical protein
VFNCEFCWNNGGVAVPATQVDPRPILFSMSAVGPVLESASTPHPQDAHFHQMSHRTNWCFLSDLSGSNEASDSGSQNGFTGPNTLGGVFHDIGPMAMVLPYMPLTVPYPCPW